MTAEDMTHNGSDMPVALVLGLDATGLAVGRILAVRGVAVYGVEFREDTIANYSRYIKRPNFGSKVDLSGAFLEQLVGFAKSYDKKPVLIPADDVFIEFVSDHFEILEKSFSIQVSQSPAVCPYFLNKKKFYLLCEEYGVACPVTLFLGGGEKVEDIVDTLKFPLILKPNLIHKWKEYLGGRKVVVINTPAELRNIFMRHSSIIADSMLQEIIPGGEDNLYLFKGYSGRDGKVKATFTGRKIRQYPPNFGTGSLAESVCNKTVEMISVKFLEAMKFQGLCGSEFKYDERDGLYKMIEINIRPQTWEDLTRIADRDILWTAYCDLAGLEVPEPVSQKEGVKWVYLTRDVFSAFWHMRHENMKVGDWVRSYKGIKTDALIDFKDMRLLARLPGYTFSQINKYRIKPFLQRFRAGRITSH
jgi:D-aspartate ligase